MYPGRLAIQQRVCPEYRAGFFDTLAGKCGGGLGVFAGQPQPREGIAPAERLQQAAFTSTQNHHFRDPASGLYLCWQGGIVDWLEAWQPDALIVEANSRILSTRGAVGWMHNHGRPVLGWGLGAPPKPGMLGRLRGFERASFLRSLDGWIAYSRRGAEEYRQLGLDPSRIFTAGNAVLARPEGPPPERIESRNRRLKVLFVGRLQRRKRIDLLLQACRRLPESLQPRLVIVGDGPDQSEMEAEAKAVYPQAEFKGAKRGEALKALFREADLFILPGTGGLAVQQAMGHGLPVIAAQGDGTQEDLVRPESGWLVPPGDLDTLEAVLREALSDPGRLRRMGAEAYRIVQEEANLEGMADVFVQAVSSLEGQAAASLL